MRTLQTHDAFGPLYDEHAKILILGSFPSVKSREQAFFYGHPQNRFWRVIAALCHEPMPQSIDGKRTLALEHGIALYDVIESCTIEGSSDSSIRDVVPANLTPILSAAPIEHIYTNGKTAGRLYERYLTRSISLPMTILPSTSPANAAWSLERLIDAWGRELPALQQRSAQHS